MKKNSCTPINPKKYSCKGLKKIHTMNLITKKNSRGSKIPPPPHNFSNGPSLLRSLALGQQIKVIINTVTSIYPLGLHHAFSDDKNNNNDNDNDNDID